MTGYMNEVIFSRILGHDDIEQGNYWADTNLCYICHRWDKIQILFDDRTDTSAWTHKITQITNLKRTIESLKEEKREAEKVKAAKLAEQKAA